MLRLLQLLVGLALVVAQVHRLCAEDRSLFEGQIAPLLKTHCVKCHGPSKREAQLNFSTPASLAKGNDQGAVVVPHDLEASRIWEQVQADDMPPDQPLSAEQKSLLKRWIIAGAPGLPQVTAADQTDQHWAFRKLSVPAVPHVDAAQGLNNAVDYFLQATRQSARLTANPEADRDTLIRRVSLDLTGLPPTLDELSRFLNDQSPDAFARMVDHYLASPAYGERWGKYWLDAVGYADSNGYFNADTDRPLAYRYRDYVIRSLNRDKGFDRFVVEQLAGDELAGFVPGQTASAETVELLEATHFLRNGQDGSGESDGNPDEVRADRYYALESLMQNATSALLGLTIQCAKCHDHKFEPISQRDYYQWQAIFYPTFHIERWVKPKDRFVYAPQADEQANWERETQATEQLVQQQRAALKEWIQANRVRGDILFEANFDATDAKLAEQWSATAPGDDSPGGAVPVQLDSDRTPAALIQNGHLQIREGGTQGDSWLATQTGFDWTPNNVGDAIQVTFDLIDNKLSADGMPAFRIGYLIALHDFNDNSQTTGGNILIDGNPNEGSAVHLDYPGADGRALGTLGNTGTTPGQNYGVRITNQGEGKYRLEHLVNSFPDEKSLELKAADLPDGAFGFEYCCGRSFVVDNVLVERLSATPEQGSQLAELKQRREALAKTIKRQKEIADARPGKIAWAADMASEAPEVHLLTRGNYATPAEVVEPGTLSALQDLDNPFTVTAQLDTSRSSGRRLACAQWMTQQGSRAAALMARVQVNRLWQHHFGTGIVATSDNLGFSGATPTHPELLDWLAVQLVRDSWSLKSLHRVILNSAAYRQSSQLVQAAYAIDPDNRKLWRYPQRRLDAEAIRDQMLAASGELDQAFGGPYISTTRAPTGEVVVPEKSAGAARRSIYLNQKRTQVVSFLNVFDAPSIVFNSVRRNTSTMPLQSLALMNSEFMQTRAQAIAVRLRTLASDETERLQLAFRLCYARQPSATEVVELNRFLDNQTEVYTQESDGRERAWRDLCQALLASSEFLYVD